MLGYPLTPPPPRGARRLTARPADPQGLGQPRGGGGATTPKTVAHPSASHIGWRRPPWDGVAGLSRELVCAPLGLKGPRGKVQSEDDKWFDAHADMFRKDTIVAGKGGHDRCWRCTKEAGLVPWPVLRMVNWAFPDATVWGAEDRGRWWEPVLRPRNEIDDGEEVEEGAKEVWWGEEPADRRAGVQIQWDTARGLQKGDEGVAVYGNLRPRRRSLRRQTLQSFTDHCRHIDSANVK